MPKHTHLILCTLRVIPKVRFRRYQILLVRHRLCRETRLGLRAHCKLQPELMRDWASIDCSLINTVHGSDPIGACSWKKLIQPPWNKRSTPYLMIVRNCDMVISWGTKNLYLSNSGRSTSFEYRLIIIYNPGFFFSIFIIRRSLTGIFVGNLTRSAKTSSLFTSPLDSLSPMIPSTKWKMFNKNTIKSEKTTWFFASLIVEIEVFNLPVHHFKRTTIVVFALVSEQLVAGIRKIHENALLRAILEQISAWSAPQME